MLHLIIKEIFKKKKKVRGDLIKSFHLKLLNDFYSSCNNVKLADMVHGPSLVCILNHLKHFLCLTSFPLKTQHSIHNECCLILQKCLCSFSSSGSLNLVFILFGVVFFLPSFTKVIPL